MSKTKQPPELTAEEIQQIAKSAVRLVSSKKILSSSSLFNKEQTRFKALPSSGHELEYLDMPANVREVKVIASRKINPSVTKSVISQAQGLQLFRDAFNKTRKS